MNIAAVMVALEIPDLDHYAKHAVLVVACRAGQHSGVARLSVRRVARDMGCHFVTARRALQRAVDSGYLTVDISAGRTSVWRLTARSGSAASDPNCAISVPPLRDAVAPTARSESRTKDTKEKYKEEPRARFYPGTGWVQPISTMTVRSDVL